LNYAKIIVDLLKRDNFMYAWLSSDSLYFDLESFYILSLPSPSDWKTLVPHPYHELCPQTFPYKEEYADGMKRIL
jgi:hypothetical protein